MHYVGMESCHSSCTTKVATLGHLCSFGSQKSRRPLAKGGARLGVWCRDDVGATGVFPRAFAEMMSERRVIWLSWHGLESCCCSSVSEPASKGLALWHGLESCCCSGVSEPASKGLALWHGLESCCCSGVSEPATKGLAPKRQAFSICRDDVGATRDLAISAREICLFFMDSKGDVKQFFGVRFAWHGLESCCCSSVSEPASKGLAPMVSEPASHRGCQTKELFFMGSKGDGKHFVGLRFAWHGLESCCCSSVSEPASKGLAPMVSEPASHRGCQTKELFFMGSKGDGKHFVGLRFAWHGLESCCCSSVSEPASKELAPMVSEPASHRGCQTKELFFMGSKGDGKHFVGLRFAWHGLESCCCSSVSEPASKELAPMVSEPASHRGCPTKELFLMGSKGDGKHFVGLRFAWHGLESCCCSSVSEPASKGLAPMVSEPASHRGCQTKELFFMGSKGDGKHFVGLRFAWHGLESCCCSSVSEPASKGLAPMVSEPASHRGCQTKELFFMGSKGDGKGCVLLGMGSNPAAVRVFRNRPPRDLRPWFRNQLESCCCSSVSEPASKELAPMVSEPASHRGCPTKELFLMGSKGDGKHFVGLRFAWHGLESCCCSSVSEPASKELAPMVSEPASHRGCQTKELFFMGSKGDGKHFVGLRFAWHGLESCCCSGVSEPVSKGLAPKRQAFSHARPFAEMMSERRVILLYRPERFVLYGFQRWREAIFRYAFCLAWARILLLFECFGTGLQRTCALAWARILLLFGCFGTGLQRPCAKATGVFPCKAICRDDVGATSDLAISGQRDDCFLWIPKVTWSSFSVCVFAWRGLESCCCSSVSEPASKGLAPMVSEPASHRGCQTKEWH